MNPLLFLFFFFFSLSRCYSNNVVLEAGDKYNLNADGSELIIKNVKKVDEGDYTCIAKNKAGEKTEEVSLNVFSKEMSSFVYMLVLRRGFLFCFVFFLFWPFLVTLIDICCTFLYSFSSC